MSLILYLLGFLWLLTAVFIRRRVGSFFVLQPSEDPPGERDWFFVSPGVKLDLPTKRAASAHARKHDLAYLDIVPTGAPALEMLGFALLVNPTKYRNQRFAPSFPAGYALLAVEETLLHCPEQALPDSLKALIRLGKCLKRYASDSSDVVVAPGLEAVRSERLGWSEMAALLGQGLPWLISIQVTQLLVILLGLMLSPPAGIFALASYHLQVAIALAGSPLRPSGIVRATLLRTLLDLWSLWALVRSRNPVDPGDDPIEALRHHYRAALGKGTDGFFEPRQTECPMCGSGHLTQRLRMGDLLQGKPGCFVLEACEDCGLVFQNPRLSTYGLDFYYKDFYDGIGHDDLERVFSVGEKAYARRARAIEGFFEPQRWLDVGTGHGHFCAVARDIWPGARFDGLDMSDCVVEAERRGWLDGKIQGMFPAVASSVRGQYDVVSMFHYLEHTVDPKAEMEASWEALRPGGLLLIEVPNPECPIGRWLGKFWICWLQPQHLHLLPVEVMKKHLTEAGFETVKLEWEETHIGVDFLFAARLFRNWAGGFPNLPWRPRRRLEERLRYWFISVPFLFVSLVAFLFDRVAAVFYRRNGISNAYRLVARKIGGNG